MTKYIDHEKPRAQIRDASVRDRSTRMPPFGRHKILTEQEIDLVVDYVLTL
jgi:L-cysteine S-thiosulfotransferase